MESCRSWTSNTHFSFFLNSSSQCPPSLSGKSPQIPQENKFSLKKTNKTKRTKLLISLRIKGWFPPESVLNSSKNNGYLLQISRTLLKGPYNGSTLPQGQDTGVRESGMLTSRLSAVKRIFFSFLGVEGLRHLPDIKYLVCFNFKRPQCHCDPEQGSAWLFV